MELITYYINADGSIATEYRGLTPSSKDADWLKRTVGNRVVYPGFDDSTWREMKPYGVNLFYAYEIPLKELPESVRLKLPKELQMKLLVGAL